jgi:Ser/Thr protein kinase RdoA (MazF antagonist)
MNTPTHVFAQLSPDQILDAVETSGYRCDGHLLALNSYENRVYQIGVEDQAPIVAKFYRPARWSDAAIEEEHAFSDELSALDIPVVSPLRDEQGVSLHRCEGFRFALYPRHGGRAPDLESAPLLEQMGRFIARLHNVGELRPFEHRPTLTAQSFGIEAYQYLLTQGFIPDSLQDAYRSLCEHLIERIQACYARAGEVAYLRLHGDCHPGNILTRDDHLHIVDLDDARTGPAIQDLWMFLSGDRAHMTARLADVLEGYSQFREFDPKELNLIEALRSLRMMHYAAWLARRWDDPAFPRAFPYFNSERYWGEHILALREQAALMDEPPLVWD